MIRALPLALLLATPPTAQGASLHLQRLDLLSEVPGSFVNYDLPMARVNGVTTAMRWVEQITLVVDLPVEGLSTGVSLGAQTLWYERALAPKAGLFAGAGLQTDLLLPKGAVMDLSWRWSRMRLGLGVCATSGASWRAPSWRAWDVLPTVGLGLGRRQVTRAEE